MQPEGLVFWLLTGLILILVARHYGYPGDPHPELRQTWQQDVQKLQSQPLILRIILGLSLAYYFLYCHILPLLTSLGSSR